MSSLLLLLLLHLHLHLCYSLLPLLPLVPPLGAPPPLSLPLGPLGVLGSRYELLDEAAANLLDLLSSQGRSLVLDCRARDSGDSESGGSGSRNGDSGSIGHSESDSSGGSGSSSISSSISGNRDSNGKSSSSISSSSSPLKAKFMVDPVRFQRECDAYNTVLGREAEHPHFVRTYAAQDISPLSISTPLSAPTPTPFLGVLVQQAGIADLVALSALGPIQGEGLKAIAVCMLGALQRVHSRGLVWTDCKLGNFVVCQEGGVDGGIDGGSGVGGDRKRGKEKSSNKSIKSASSSAARAEGGQQGLGQRQEQEQEQGQTEGQAQLLPGLLGLPALLCMGGAQVRAIDLESCVALLDQVRDFSPEVMAPEQLPALSASIATLAGGMGGLRLDNVRDLPPASPSLDAWALGISLLHLYLGKAPITAGPEDVAGACGVLTEYVAGRTDLGMSQVQDLKLRRLLVLLLAPDPSLRPDSSSLKNKAYFRG